MVIGYDNIEAPDARALITSPTWIMPCDTTEQTIARLIRELAHVTEQCRVAHAMAMDWKARAPVAETQVRRLQLKADRGRDPGIAPRATRAVGDGRHDHLDLLEQV